MSDWLWRGDNEHRYRGTSVSKLEEPDVRSINMHIHVAISNWKMCDTVVIKKVRDGNSQYTRKRVLVKEMEQLLQLDEINHKNKNGK